MPEQSLIREPLHDQRHLDHPGQPDQSDHPDHRVWRSVAFLLILFGCLAITMFVLVAVVGPAVGAAGGCGGG